MIRALPLLTLAACQLIEPMPGDQPCKEVGWAFANRTYTCTGDVDLANRRYEALQAATTCISHTADDPALDTARPEDLFSCAFTIRNLPCETLAEIGDDIDALLATDPSCDWVIRGGEQ